MKSMFLVAALALSASLPLVAQEEAPPHYRHRVRVESPYRDFGRMGREFGKMGREYGRMGREFGRIYGREYGRIGREYARYGRNWSRQWRGQDFGPGLRKFSHDVSRNWGREWSRMGRGFHMRPRRGDI